MLKHLSILSLFLCTALPGPAQETGCFKQADGHGLQLETNIDLGRYDAFFVGELHGVYGTIGIKLALTEYLNIHCGVSDVFMEVGYSTAWLYNRYLQTGDTTLFTTPKLVYAMKQANRDFWKDLYVYNKTAAHKITIHGMDFERMDFLKVLKLLMPPGKEKPEEISAVLTYIDTAVVTNVNSGIWDEGQDVNQRSIYDSVRTNIQANRRSYKHYYGANFKTVEQIMSNKNTYGQYSYRNKAMYGNMMAEIKEQGIKKFVTFNGLRHGSRSYTDQQPLCYRLAKSKAFRNNLADISMVCKNCHDWLLRPGHMNATFRAPYTYLADTALLNSMFETHYNAGCKYTLVPSGAVEDARVKAFSDYLILMKDQPEY